MQYTSFFNNNIHETSLVNKSEYEYNGTAKL